MPWLLGWRTQRSCLGEPLVIAVWRLRFFGAVLLPESAALESFLLLWEVPVRGNENSKVRPSTRFCGGVRVGRRLTGLQFSGTQGLHGGRNLGLGCSSCISARISGGEAGYCGAGDLILGAARCSGEGRRRRWERTADGRSSPGCPGKANVPH